jgi:AcrR family transcriptional regulator
MKADRDDRRVRYTKMVLKESLIGLLKQKTIDKITVTELCETADLNRSTFYAYFSDPFDLLHQIERELLHDLSIYIGDTKFIADQTETAQLIVRIFEYIAANADLCLVLLGENGDITFLKELLTYVQQLSVREWEGVKSVDAELVDFLSLFGVNGCIGVVQRWLQTDMRKTPQEMAEIIIKLMYQGLTAYLI